LKLPRRRAIAISFGVLLVGTVAALLATPPLARRKIRAVAVAQHLSVDVGAIRPGFFSVTLTDVRVSPEGEVGISATFPEIRVSLSAGLSPKRLELHRGELTLQGSPDEVAARVSRWKSNRSPSSSGAGKKEEREIVADGLSLAWTAPEGTVTVKGASLGFESDRLELRAESVIAKRPEGEVVVRGASVSFDEKQKLRLLQSDAVTVALVGRQAAVETAAPPSSASLPPLPVLAPIAKKGERPTKTAKAAPAPTAPDAGPFTPFVPFPDLEKLRAELALVTKALADKLPEASEVRVPALSLEMGGATPFTLGPGPFSFLRGKDSLVVSFKSNGVAGSAPLSIELLSPIGAGDPSLTLDGGPIPLSLLGLREGALGLVEVNRATIFAKGRVSLDSQGKSANFDGEARLANASILQPRLSRETLRGLTLGVSGRGLVTSGSVRLDDAQVTLGTTRLGLHGNVEQDDSHLRASLAFDLPTVACQDLATSVPQGLMPTVRTMRFGGAFGARGRVAFDTKNLDALELEYAIDDRCRAAEVPNAVSRERFATAFTHVITHPDGTLGEARTGPGSGNWTELGGISPYMPVAVLTTEDGSFFRHHGFNHTAIRQSLVANVKARKFVRGASTITMQLAKNLFLVREKTLSRKLEEIVLADYLEQVFRKDDLLELYLNVVEFGPDVYGITQAASHYFGRSPLELNLPECLFLATLLPSPVRSHHLTEHAELPEHWRKHLHVLMRIAERSHRISPSELEEGLTEPVVFHKPGAPHPPPRPPRKSYGDLDGEPEPEGDWHRLE
jgi:hypothetical protein